MNMFNNGYYGSEDRFFWMPFILGGLSGAAITSVASRPRPVYVNSYPSMQMPYYYNPGYMYGSGYNYYY